MHTDRRGAPRPPVHRRLTTLAVAAALSIPTALTPLTIAHAEPSEPAVGAGLHTAAEAAALSEAADSGEAVEVVAQRTETSQVFANPSGTMTVDTYATPQWTRQGNRLVKIDTALKSEPGGRISPAATSVDLSFSGGGTGPLATVTRDGRSMSLTWPGTLPAPELADDTATYSEVLPGVDLKVKASTTGFSEVLVVKSAAAAANPALKAIAFKLDTDGIEVSVDEHGNLKAVNPAGQEVFTAPTPRMWDSSSATASPAALWAAGEPVDAGSPPGDDFEPGNGAQETPMPIDVASGHVTVAPDQSLLTGNDTAYPVYIDPAVDGGLKAWTIAYKKTPNTGYYNGAGWGGSGSSTSTARVGYENETNGLGRSIFRLSTTNLWNTNKQVLASTFRIKNTWSWSCNKRKIGVWLTGGISTSTTWNSSNNNTFWASKLDETDDTRGWGPACPAGKIAFNVKAAAVKAAAGDWTNVTLGLKALDEGDEYAWKKFDANSAVMSTTYNTIPNTPAKLDTIPSSGGCRTTSAFETIGNTDIYLTAQVKDAEGGNVKAQFNLWPTGHHPNDDPNGVMIVSTTASAPSGSVAKLKVSKETLKKYISMSNGNFSWKAQAEDATSSSAWVPKTGLPGCRFVFDPNRPSNPPAISSTAFPNGDDGWPAVTGQAFTTGDFTVKSGETAEVPDVVKYEYWTDWDPTVRTKAAARAGGPVTLPLQPPGAGSHSLYVVSIDGAGNRSDRTQYLFYANSPTAPAKDGDLNRDGNADMYGVRSNGELWLYPGQNNGYVGTYTIASNADFTGATVTHRGDWNQDGNEDLIAAIPGADGKNLSLFPNNGLGFACTARDEQADGASKACTYDQQALDVYDPANNHWANADQILAIGDVDGPLDTDGDGTTDVPGFPDLLVKEGQRLWLYYGSQSLYMDESRAPVLVGTGGWASYDLAAPGDRTANGHVDLIARNKTNGELRLYPGSGPDGQGLGTAAASSVIGTGWTPTNRPLITAVPDANGDNKADIWATNTAGQLLYYSNLAGSGTTVGTGGWKDFQSLS